MESPLVIVKQINKQIMKKQAINPAVSLDVSLIAFLQEYLPYIDSKIPTKINSGGCGFVAYHLTKALNKLGIKAEPYVFTQNPDHAIKKINHFINDPQVKLDDQGDNEIGVGHSIVKIGEGLYLDIEGLFKSNPAICELPLFSPISMERLEILNNHVNSWNPIFDRSLVPKIEKYLIDIPVEYTNYLKGKHFVPIMKGKLNAYTIDKIKERSELSFMNRMFR